MIGRVVLFALGFGAGGDLVRADESVTTAELAARVIILANDNEPESRQLAKHYAEARGIPLANIVALPITTAEIVSWPEFIETIFSPLQDWLVEREWVDGIGMDLTDEFGRRKYAMSGHRISYLVVCRGVPLKISNQAEWLRDELAQRLPEQFRRNTAALDSELAVIAASGTPVNGFIPNPLYQLSDPPRTRLEQIVRVSRLDGPTYATAKRLVDDAIAVEQQGLIGRAYLDRGGPFAHGDAWLETAEASLRADGWDVAAHPEGGTMPATARADAMAVYLGWYAGEVVGPFGLPGFQLARGAIALHIHSFSAQTLRVESGGGWTGPLVARGAAATFGNVDEPYLEYTHRPDVLIAALMRGARLGAAAFEAMPAVSWQALVVGDPLYQPWAVPLATQVAQIEQLPPLLAPYVAAREMIRRSAAREPAEALAWGRTQLGRTPSLALGLAVAGRLVENGAPKSAARTLGFAKWVSRAPVSDWGLQAEIAERLAEWGDGPTSTEVWRTLFAHPLPDDVRRRWLETARASATKANQPQAALEWSRQLIALTPAVPN